MPDLSARAAGYGQAISSQAFTQDATTASALTVPALSRSALITTGTQSCRYRVDGTDPTTAVGHLIAANGNVEIFDRDLSKFRIIATSATSAIFVTYFKD